MERVDDVSAVARTIISKLCNPFDITGTEVSISASIGITLCPFDAKNVKELMIDADRAMYVAKASGKNRFEFYSEEFSDLDTRGPSGPRW
jgi:diguanylate cyclase (GGDEF)-like protein